MAKITPDKLYYRIGEVSEITGVEAYVLRFWESEFKKIKPKRTPSGQRLYRKADVETVLAIKHLLYERKFTIQGAIQHLGSKGRDAVISEKKNSFEGKKEEMRNELLSIREILDK